VPYLTADDAMAKGLFSVSEVSEAGSVPELEVRNRGPLPVLLLDGEELVGAKQNRIVNLTILVAAQSTLVIPVSCVEAGRWHHRSRSFTTSPRTHYAAARAAKAEQVSASMRETGSRRSDQSAIWADIADKSARLAVSSPTCAMADMFEQFDDDVESYVEAMTGIPGQVGAIFALDGRVRGLECFDAEATFRQALPKLVRSYALDAIETPRAAPRHARSEEALALAEAVAAAETAALPAVGLGEDVRFTREGISGGALVADGRVVHLAAFAQ
jgi:hypothetical protein